MSTDLYSRRRFLRTTSLGLASLAWLPGEAGPAASYLLYVGTYETEGDTIFLYRLNPATGALSRIGAYDGGRMPTYIALDSRHRYLYAANRQPAAGASSGIISAFVIDQRTGGLRLLNQQSSRGDDPCYISLDRTNRLALAANYPSGNVSALPVRADGQLAPASAVEQHVGAGPHPNQQQAHAHCFLPAPDNRFAFSADLGTDQVYGYQLDARRGQLRPLPAPAFRTAPGAGPRHLTFHPNGRFAYLINELNSTVVALAYAARPGQFREINTLSTLPAGFAGPNAAADIHVAPNGRFLYASNRGHDSLVVFAIDVRTGGLALVQHLSSQGRTPRNFALDPSGQILLAGNQHSSTIFTYFIDDQSGRLTPTGQSVPVPTPVCLRVGPDFLRRYAQPGWAAA